MVPPGLKDVPTEGTVENFKAPSIPETFTDGTGPKFDRPDGAPSGSTDPKPEGVGGSTFRLEPFHAVQAARVAVFVGVSVALRARGLRPDPSAVWKACEFSPGSVAVLEANSAPILSWLQSKLDALSARIPGGSDPRAVLFGSVVAMSAVAAYRAASSTSSTGSTSSSRSTSSTGSTGSTSSTESTGSTSSTGDEFAWNPSDGL